VVIRVYSLKLVLIRVKNKTKNLHFMPLLQQNLKNRLKRYLIHFCSELNRFSNSIMSRG